MQFTAEQLKQEALLSFLQIPLLPSNIPKGVIQFSKNDGVGLRHQAVLSQFVNMF